MTSSPTFSTSSGIRRHNISQECPSSCNLGTVQIDNRSIIARKVERLDPQRDGIFRLEIEPTLDLPPTIIVKQQKNSQETWFHHEIEVYKRLQALQGKVIPQLLGVGSFNGAPALLLSEIFGPTLYDLARDKHSGVNPDDVKSQLEISLESLTKEGAIYWDQRLDNFILSKDGRIMIIDLEDVAFPKEPTDRERGINFAGVRYLMSRFRDARDPNRPPSPVPLWHGS